jgi:biopolymer transport protein ExbD
MLSPCQIRGGAFLALLAAAVAVCGCAVSLQLAELSLTPDGNVVVNGQSVEPTKVPSVLKTMGANAGTSIRVSIPESTTRTAMAKLTGSLSSAGFRKILFVKPQKTEAVADTLDAQPRR